jgi:hypothetical protein
MLDSLGKRVIWIGVCIAAFGMAANQLIGPLFRLLSKFSLFNIWSITSLCIVLLGLLVAFVGGLVWACTEDRLISLLTWGLSVAIGAAAMMELSALLNAPTTSPWGFLLPFFLAAELTSAFILLIAALRFLSDRWQSRARNPSQ